MGEIDAELSRLNEEFMRHQQEYDITMTTAN